MRGAAGRRGRAQLWGRVAAGQTRRRPRKRTRTAPGAKRNRARRASMLNRESNQPKGPHRLVCQSVLLLHPQLRGGPGGRGGVGVEGPPASLQGAPRHPNSSPTGPNSSPNGPNPPRPPRTDPQRPQPPVPPAQPAPGSAAGGPELEPPKAFPECTAPPSPLPSSLPEVHSPPGPPRTCAACSAARPACVGAPSSGPLARGSPHSSSRPAATAAAKASASRSSEAVSSGAIASAPGARSAPSTPCRGEYEGVFGGGGVRSKPARRRRRGRPWRRQRLDATAALPGARRQVQRPQRGQK
jgi:hypothetical protein